MDLMKKVIAELVDEILEGSLDANHFKFKTRIEQFCVSNTCDEPVFSCWRRSNFGNCIDFKSVMCRACRLNVIKSNLNSEFSLGEKIEISSALMNLGSDSESDDSNTDLYHISGGHKIYFSDDIVEVFVTIRNDI